MYHLKDLPFVPLEPLTTLPHPTLCPWRCILTDLYGSLLWLQVGLGQQAKWRGNMGVSEPGVYIPQLPPCGVKES